MKTNKSIVLATTFSLSILILITVYVLICEPPSFDGAMNLQAARNISEQGYPILDYGTQDKLQTNAPIQIINAISLLFFQDNFAHQFTNIIFVFLALLILLKISLSLGTAVPLLLFALLTVTKSFRIFAYNGFGEFPALIIGLAGIFFLLRNNSKRDQIISGLLLGLSLSIKWVMILILPSVFFCLLIKKLKTNQLVLLIFISIVTFLSFFFYQHVPDNFQGFKKLLPQLVEQTTPREAGELYDELVLSSSYLSYIYRQFHSYLSNTGTGLFVIKIFLLIGILWYLNKIRNSAKLTLREQYFLALGIFILTYLLWFFLLSSREWPRRYFNLDILIFFAAGFAFTYHQNFFWSRLINFSICFFTILNLNLVYKDYDYCQSCEPIKNETLNLNALTTSSEVSCSVEAEKNRMISAVSNLNPNFQGFGIGFWEAPYWSLILNQKFKDLYQSNVFSDCILSTCSNYIFLDRYSSGDNSFWEVANQVYKLERVYDVNNNSIYRVVDFNFGKKELTPIGINNYLHYQIYKRLPKFNLEQGFYFTSNKSKKLELNYKTNSCIADSLNRIVFRFNSNVKVVDLAINSLSGSLNFDLADFEETQIFAYLITAKNLNCTELELQSGLQITDLNLRS